MLFQFLVCKHVAYRPRASVRRRGKNVDSSSKSNPLRRRVKNYDASKTPWHRREGVGVVIEKNEESR